MGVPLCVCAQLDAERTVSPRKQAAERFAREHGWPIRNESAHGDVFDLMEIRQNRPLFFLTLNERAAISTATDQVRNQPPLYPQGDGWRIGVWDVGLALPSHQELPTRVVSPDHSEVASHSTHVAGTLVAKGVDSRVLGMAPEATLRMYNWDDDTNEMLDEGAATAEAVLNDNAIAVSNHSYGHVVGWIYWNFSGQYGYHWFGRMGELEDRNFGRYEETAQEWDQVCFDRPYYLPFKSAGNDRSEKAPSVPGATWYYLDENDEWMSGGYDPETDPPSDAWDNGGFDTLPTFANSKNIMVVGAVNDAWTDGVRDLTKATMSTFSSWGPTDDGRIKPDIVANGTSLRSCYTPNDDSYFNSSGTSMSSPNAAGSAILLQELYNRLTGGVMRAATLKALIIHTTDDLNTPGPDYITGWGLMNTRQAADLIETDAAMPYQRHLIEDELSDLNPSATYAITWNGEDPIRVTLCWTDPPGPVVEGLDNSTNVLVNDLDLRVQTPLGFSSILPYVLDPANPTHSASKGNNTRDNVEQVLVIAPLTQQGVYQVRVTHKGALVGGKQAFSLILSGQSTTANVIDFNAWQ